MRAALTAPFVDPARDSWLATDPDGTAVAWAILDNPTGVGREYVDVSSTRTAAPALRAPLLDRPLDRVAERAAERGLPR